MRHDYAIYRTEAEKTSSLALPTFRLGLFLGGIRNSPPEAPGPKVNQAIMKGQYRGLDITFVLCYIIK